MSEITGHIVIFPGLDGTGVLSRGFAAGDWHGHPVTVIPLPKDGPQDYDSLAERLVGELPRGPLVLIGESFSGPLAMKVAKVERGRVEALIIAGGFCESPAPPALALIPLRPFFMVPPPALLLRKYLAGPEASQEAIASLTEAIRSVPAGTLAQRAEVVLALQERDCPSFKDLPILLLHARNDKAVPWKYQSGLERHFPKAQARWIDSAHLLLATCPDECREAVLEFLAG